MIAVVVLVSSLAVAGLLYFYFIIKRKLNYVDRRDVLHSTPLPFVATFTG